MPDYQTLEPSEQLELIAELDPISKVYILIAKANYAQRIRLKAYVKFDSKTDQLYSIAWRLEQAIVNRTGLDRRIVEQITRVNTAREWL